MSLYGGSMFSGYTYTDRSEHTNTSSYGAKRSNMLGRSFGFRSMGMGPSMGMSLGHALAPLWRTAKRDLSVSRTSINRTCNILDCRSIVSPIDKIIIFNLASRRAVLRSSEPSEGAQVQGQLLPDQTLHKGGLSNLLLPSDTHLLLQPAGETLQRIR